MLNRIIAAAALAITGAVVGLQSTNASPYVNYPGGANYYEICNRTDRSYVTFYTDETYGEHSLANGECTYIYTDASYLVVNYDESWAPGNQFDTVYVYYPEDLVFQGVGNDAYGELIGHYTW